MTRFKDNKEPVGSSDLYYDLFDGGYLEPEDFLADATDAENVRKAMRVVEDYLSDMSDSGMIEEY